MNVVVVIVVVIIIAFFPSDSVTYPALSDENSHFLQSCVGDLLGKLFS